MLGDRLDQYCKRLYGLGYHGSAFGHAAQEHMERSAGNGVSPSIAYMGEGQIMDGKSVLIGVLVIALAVVGYMYWDSQRTGIEIRAPGVTIKGG